MCATDVATTCNVTLVTKQSTPNCTPATAFGCDDTRSFWIKHGCRGIFECGQQTGTTQCGVGGFAAPEKTTCPCGLTDTVNTTLVVAFGSIRGGRLASESVVHHLLRPLSADLAVLTSYDHDTSCRGDSCPLLLRHAKHLWRVPEYHDWSRLVDEVLADRAPDWRERVRPTINLWGPVHGRQGSGAIIFSLRMVVLRYLDALAFGGVGGGDGSGGSYRTVILTRHDQVYACDHPHLEPAAREVLVQAGEEYGDGAVSDRHTVFRFADRHLLLPVLPWLVKTRPYATGNPERILGAFFAAQNLTVRKFARVAFVVRVLGVDSTRWYRPEKLVAPCLSPNVVEAELSRMRGELGRYRGRPGGPARRLHRRER